MDGLIIGSRYRNGGRMNIFRITNFPFHQHVQRKIHECQQGCVVPATPAKNIDLILKFSKALSKTVMRASKIIEWLL